MQSTAGEAGWGWSKGPTILLHIAEVAIILVAAATVSGRFRHLFTWKLLLPAWGAALLLSWSGVRWRIASTRRQQAARDRRAAELVHAVFQNEARRFALYIRPFDWTGALPIRNPEFDDNPFNRPPEIDVEEYFAQGLPPDLPLIALGWPGEAIGAGRWETDDTTWQRDVHALAEKSTLILALPFYSDSMMWEVKLLRDRGWLKKTLFVNPPTRTRYRFTGTRRWGDASKKLEEFGIVLPAGASKGQIFVLTPDGASLAGTLPFPSRADEVSRALHSLFPEQFSEVASRTDTEDHI